MASSELNFTFMCKTYYFPTRISEARLVCPSQEMNIQLQPFEYAFEYLIVLIQDSEASKSLGHRHFYFQAAVTRHSDLLHSPLFALRFFIS